MICFPNAKINLGLHVLSKREDGFHNISSVLLPISYADALEYQPSDTYKISIYGINIPDEDNIVTKAWRLMNEKYHIPPLQINLLKQIPMGSGLGGGSSDAAFLIRSLNNTFKLNLSIKEMQNDALQVGSDCPFFILNKTSIVSGKGEFIEPINLSLTDKYLAVIIPGIKASTKSAYASITPSKPELPISKIINLPIETWKENLVNDFERPIFDLHPGLKRIKHDLYLKGAIYASLSGTGSALYGVFNKFPDLSFNDFGCPVRCFRI